MNRHARTTNRTPLLRAARRGSALLIVIGILALVAVLGAIYISIGQSDTQSARAVTQRARNEAVSFDVGSALARAIAADRLDTYLIPSSTGTTVNTQRAARETWDYPYTDWSVRSSLLAGVQEYQLFTPPGRHTLLNLANPAGDPRVAYDPWLASTEPEYLGPEEAAPFTPPSFPTGRVFSNNRPEGYWLDRRDWWQISNLSPDGRFVNLFNLRPQENPFTGAVGGFDARPVVGAYPDPVTGVQRAGMTSELTLLRPFQLDGVETTIQAFDPLASGVWTPGADAPYAVPGLSGVQLYNTPAVWTMFQRYMFFPMNQEFIMHDRGGSIADWSSPDYPAYVYADADGDGMADSRWAELVDASDPDNIIELDGDPDYRVFFAARVMDLSALVNVNTAGDLLFAPTVDYPYGLSLSEIDLRRLLTMSDQGMEWSGRWNGTGTAANQIYVKASPFGSGLTFANLDSGREDRSQQGIGTDPVSVYRSSALGLIDTSDGLNDPLSGYFIRFPDYASGDLLAEAAKLHTGEVIGAHAYDALRLAIERESALDSRFYGLISDSLPPAVAPADDFRLITSSNFSYEYDPVNDPARNTALADQAERGARRFDYTRDVGRLDVSRPEDRVATPDDFGAGLFGIGDLGELLTYRGVNDPAVTSRLEQAMLGRSGDGVASSRTTARRLTPLLSNRPLDFDRFGHGDGRLRGGGEPFPFVRGQIDPESMALFALSPRLRLTTFNGAADLVPALGVTPGTALTTGDVARTLGGLFSDPAGLFGVFRSSLVPFGSFQNNALASTWYDDVSESFNNPRPTITLNYPHASAELGTLLAAHLALNAADMGDADTAPTAATLIMDNSARQTLDTDSGFAIEDRVYPWSEAGTLLDPGQSNIPGGSNGASLSDDSRQVRNIFGVEAQPFLIEASSLVVFSDTGNQLGSDVDYLPLDQNELECAFTGVGCVPPAGLITPDDVPEITINTTPSWDGGGGPQDMLLQLIAFKLTNPFDEPVSLGAPTWNEDERRWENYDYYVEYAGRFYMLARFVEFSEELTEQVSNNDGSDDFAEYVSVKDQLQPVSIGARETVVFYALANNEVGHDELANASKYDFRDVDLRWAAEAGGVTPTDADEVTGRAWEWVNQQLAVDGRPVRIKEFDPETGRLRAVADTQTGTQLWRDVFQEWGPADNAKNALATQRNPDRVKNNVVRLWRTLRATGLDETDTTRYNVVENDLLADRLSASVADSGRNILDPAEPVAGRGNGSVDGTLGFSAGLPLAGGSENGCGDSFEIYRPGSEELGRNDNTGWTLALWGTIRRPDGSDGPDDDDFGLLPPWMLEVRDPAWSDADSPTAHVNVARRWDDFDEFNGFTADGFDVGDFTFYRACGGGLPDQPIGSPDGFGNADPASAREFDYGVIVKGTRSDGFVEIQPSMEKFFQLGPKSGADDGKRVVHSLSRKPGSPLPGGLTPGTGEDSLIVDKFRLSRELGNNVAGDSLHGATDRLRPELFHADGFANSDGRSTARPGDLLLALGVGPVQAPNPMRAGNASFAYDLDEEWLTLSEALAIAFGYDVPRANDLADEPETRLDDPYYGIVNNWADTNGDGAPDWRYALPDGRLAIDDYVSFFDRDGDRVFTEPTLAAVNDVRTGSGLPMALDVLGRVRLHEPAEPLEGANTGFRLTRVVPGRININTAPASTLRLLPGLAPSLQSFTPTPGTATLEPEWWVAQHAAGASGSMSVLPDLSNAGKTPDIAGSIVAYRDRLKPVWRRASDPASAVPGPGELRFDPNAALFPYGDFPGLASQNFSRDVSRSYTTGIRALRETPGFRSTGELLAVTLSDTNPDGTTPNPNFDAYRHNTVRAYGLDGEALFDGDTLPDVGMGDDDIASIESDVYDGDKADRLVDDMGEQVAIANQVLGSVTVSSDVYAVWYVVHGYREADVAELRPGDPLVPSFARRYVMVVDRSNVTAETDAPRIVYFREVPM